MILVINREMLIPNNERYIGTTYDEASMNRVFQIARYTNNGVDLSALSFKLDLEYNTGDKDTSDLSKVVDDENITLTWEVPNSCLQVPGTAFINLRANDTNGTVKWASFRAAVYVEDTINTPGTYTGDLTELEQLEARVAGVISSENTRVAAEEARVAAEAARVTAETARETAEDERETSFDEAIAEFNETRQELEDMKDAAAASAAEALIYKNICETYSDIVVPVFHVDFTDGNVYYNDTATFLFRINQSTGDMEYEYATA